MTSCQKDKIIDYATLPIVTVIHSPNGLGDRSYNDLIAHGALRSAEDFELRITTLTPSSLAEADTTVKNWLSYTANDPRNQLLIVASDDYEPIILKYKDQIPDDKRRKVILLESRATHLPAYTCYLPFYGACYQAGYIAGRMEDVQSAVVLCANPYTQPLIDGSTAFTEAFVTTGKKEPPIYYLAEDDSGYYCADTLYKRGDDLNSYFNLVFPLVGGSAQGLYRYNRENPTSFYSVGIDTDMSGYSKRIPFSVVKHIDRVVYDYIARWFKHKDLPRNQCLGLEQGMTEVIISPEYQNKLSPFEQEIRAKAILLEQQYEEKR